MSWFVYILKCRDNSFYVGLTTNLKRRLSQHNNGIFVFNYTKSRRPVRLIYWERYNDKHEAALREKEIKDWRREKKIRLIKKFTSSN
jgi:putative endonuclease